MQVEINYDKRHLLREAALFIAADRSDPFLRNRVVTHINNGIAQPGDYTAEVREEDGKTIYHSIKRV
jgi:hypothetical protein